MNIIRSHAFLALVIIGTLPVVLLSVASASGVDFSGKTFLGVGLLTCMAAYLLAHYLSHQTAKTANIISDMLRIGGKTLHSPQIPAEFHYLGEEVSHLISVRNQALLRMQQELEGQQHKIKEAESAAMRSLQVLHQLVEQSSEGIVFMHAKGHVTLLGRATVKMFQLEDSYASPGADAKAWLNTVAASMRDGQATAKQWTHWQENPCANEEGEWEMAAGNEPRWIRVKLCDVHSESEGYVGKLWIFCDVTEQRKIEQRLKEAQKMESLGQLTGGIAHDFNNLLTAIRGSLDLLKLERDPSQTQNKIQVARQATTRASELVSRLLSFSKPKPQYQDAEVQRVLSDMTCILQASLDPKVNLQVHADNLHWHVALDATQLEQVLLNLCLNARDALPSSGGQITVHTEQVVHAKVTSADKGHNVCQAGEFVLVRVRDSGHGIPEEVGQRIFEAFFTTKSPEKGTGLGLAMAHSIVTEAGGWMEYDSTLGEGTEFRLYLPRSTKQAVPIMLSQEPRPSTSALLTPANGDGTILVVDDEASVRSIAVHMLKYLGYRVLEAENGEQALELLDQSTIPIDAILMDVYMPKLSGRDTFKILRQRGNDIPVIVCSGFNIDQDEFIPLASGRTGPIEVIQKPYAMDRLAKAVARAVEKGHNALAA